MDTVMLWVLTAGGFLEQLRGDQPSVSDAMVALTYGAAGAIVAVTMSYATVGALLAARSGAGRLGTVLLAGGLAFGAIPFGYVVGGSLVHHEPLDPFRNAIFLIGPATIAAGYSLILPVVALIFPHGDLPSAHWRWPVRAAAALLAAATTITVLQPGEIAGTPSRNPFGIETMPPALLDLSGVLTGVGIIAISLIGIAAVVVRYRRGSVVERQQLRWFVAAVALAAVPLALSPQTAIGGPVWLLIAALGLLLVPVSVWIAVTRYRLYEIDQLISRGLAWGVLTGLLVAVYAGAVLVLQGLLSGVTQGQTLAVAGSTLLAAALFQPLRNRVQRAMDRRFDRARYDAERTVAGFAERLRDVIDLSTLSAEVRRVTGETVRPTSVAVWLRPAAESQKSPVS
jgi:hypothetical protein